jgi:hypothetical protein
VICLDRENAGCGLDGLGMCVKSVAAHQGAGVVTVSGGLVSSFPL